MTRRSVPKVTVVVPVYKVERYLRECVDSILRQTLKDIEVILIDDGSPDNCGAIIDEYAAHDKRVVPVHQENSGYSAAVNRGISMARGKYIGIIESDDWIEPDMYETLYKKAEKLKSDVCKAMFYIYNSTAKIGMQDIVYRNPSNVDLDLAPDGNFTAAEWPKILAFHASIWSSIYRADFVKKYPIPESAGASYQDFPFMVQVMTKAKKISVVKRPMVHWRNDPGQGNSTSANGPKLLLMAQNTKLMFEIARKTKDYPKYREALFAHAKWANYGFFYRIDKKYRKEYYEIMHGIFTEVFDDPTFQYTYFEKEDLKEVQCFQSWKKYRRSIVSRRVAGVRFRFWKFMRSFFPTYRVVTFVKEQNWNTQQQIESLSRQVEVLQRQIDELTKKK